MKDYGILAARDGDKLVRMVNNEMARGYQPIGGVQVVADKWGKVTFYQAMIGQPPPLVITHSGHVTKEAAERMKKAIVQEIADGTGRI